MSEMMPGGATDPVFHFVSKSYHEDIIANFHQQRLEGKFLDVTLKVGYLCAVHYTLCQHLIESFDYTY